MVDPVVAEPAAAPDAPSVVQKLSAELVGTFVLVFFGCGSVAYAAQAQTFDILAVALTFGLAVMVMVYAFGRVSGGHFNPAVSLAAAVGGRVAWREVPLYVAAQLAGAIVAGGLLLALLQGYEGYDVDRYGLGQNFYGDQGSGYALWSALLLEALLTLIFVLVILAVTDSRNEHPALAPLAIGFTLAAIHLVAIPATGTSVNPARSIGPALFSGTDAIQQVWVFIVAPLVGAFLGGLLYPALFGRAGEPVPGSGLRFPERPASPAAVGSTDAYQQQWNQQVWSGEPIIQDGWQWDPYAQQWIPAPPQAPAAPPAPPAGPTTPAPGHAAPPAPGHAAPPQQQGPDDGHTQIRPPQV